MLNKEVLISFELLDHLSNHCGASAQVKNVTSSIPLRLFLISFSFYQMVLSLHSHSLTEIETR